MSELAGKTVFITGASRGIGRAIALRCAHDGANVVIAAKTTESHPKLPGTIHDTAREVEAAGGNALAVQLDVREAERFPEAVQQTVSRFGGIDILVNNAGAITLLPVETLPLRKLDLMIAVNFRAPLALSQACVPHLKKSTNPHILNLSPPIDLTAHWLAGFTGYTMTKYGMSLLTIGLAEELKPYGIAVNSLWPKTTIATAAVQMLGGDLLAEASRTPEIVADAAHAVFTTPARELTGRHLMDEEFLRSRGVTDFERYAVQPGAQLMPDFYAGSTIPLAVLGRLPAQG
ncbi:MAG: NAD(P)-dependent oxidoreductase [Planctomycetes bacterium]|nr:NAD(P)-dependent oxidoreductase [Planctomycetota bacterium]